MKRSILITFGIALVLALTNPGPQAYTSWFRAQLNDTGFIGGLMSALMPDAVIEKSTRRTNLLLLSIYTTNISYKDAVSTIGALGFFHSFARGTPAAAPTQKQSSAQTPPKTATPPRLPTPDDASEPKCEPAELYRREGRFLPGVTEVQVLVVQRQQQGTTAEKAYCAHVAVVGKYNINTNDYPVVWSIVLHGAGLVFTDGYWHRPVGAYSAKVDVIRVITGSMDQVLTVDGGSFGGNASDYTAKVIAFSSPNGTAETLLSLWGEGLDVHADGEALVVSAYVVPPGACHACGATEEFRLRYDPTVNRLGRVTPRFPMKSNL